MYGFVLFFFYLPCVLIACLQDNGKKWDAPFEKAKATNSVSFLWGAYFCIGDYKHNVVVVIKSVAYNNYNIRP